MNLRTTVLTFIMIVAFCLTARGQSSCLYWQSRVDESVKMPGSFQPINEENPENVMQAIECLLKLEGNRNKAKFSGVTNPRVSQLFEPATVEVAALFYVSYLFYQKWDHADAIALVGDDQQTVSSPKTLRKAYKYYREWFKQVKTIGIVKAREMKVEPLKGKDVRWY